MGYETSSEAIISNDNVNNCGVENAELNWIKSSSNDDEGKKW